MRGKPFVFRHRKELSDDRFIILADRLAIYPLNSERSIGKDFRVFTAVYVTLIDFRMARSSARKNNQGEGKVCWRK
jgi:hypothetical protein